MARWTRVVGDGLVYEGPCLLKHIILMPGDADRYVDIHDGRDATSGKKFCRLNVTYEGTDDIYFGEGVPFDVGIYIDAESSEEETTIVFQPLPE